MIRASRGSLPSGVMVSVQTYRRREETLDCSLQLDGADEDGRKYSRTRIWLHKSIAKLDRSRPQYRSVACCGKFSDLGRLNGTNMHPRRVFDNRVRS